MYNLERVMDMGRARDVGGVNMWAGPGMWVESLCVYNFGQSHGCGRGQGRGWSHYACVCRQGQECGWGHCVCIILGRVVDVGGARDVGGVIMRVYVGRARNVGGVLMCV